MSKTNTLKTIKYFLKLKLHECRENYWSFTKTTLKGFGTAFLIFAVAFAAVNIIFPIVVLLALTFLALIGDPMPLTATEILFPLFALEGPKKEVIYDCIEYGFLILICSFVWSMFVIATKRACIDELLIPWLKKNARKAKAIAQSDNPEEEYHRIKNE